MPRSIATAYPLASALFASSVFIAQACSDHQTTTGTPASGGAAASSSGGQSTSAGGAGGTNTASSGGQAGQSTPASGGSNSGGSGAAPQTGGASSGGASNAGGSSSGGSTTASGGAGGTGATGGSSAGGVSSSCTGPSTAAKSLPQRADVLNAMRLGNTYFMNSVPDPTLDTVNSNKTHASNIWTRGVYYEGLMALYAIETDATRKTNYYNYAVKWGASAGHPWQLAGGGTTTRSADNQCCGQTYLDLYQIDQQAVRVHDIKADIDMVVSGSSNADWTWIDAIQMAMPVFAKLGVIYSSTNYFEKMHAMYVNAKTTQGFYSTTDHLWWRDATFEPPYKTPNGKQCYWSRGNGWVFAALTRVLDITPTTAPYRDEYTTDFKAMAAALAAVQRSDGFWNVSLADPDDHGGSELTGTSLFTYGLAWGIRQGVLDRATYEPIVSRAWCAMLSAVHTNGFLGYAQGSGSKPADGQPVTFDSVPDFQDFPTGCFLLGGSEVWKLATQ